MSSTVSGSFYCRVPEGAGKIRFHDPRGEHMIMQKALTPAARYSEGAARSRLLPLPPFTRSYAVDVAEGMLVLFPSWLLHEVEGADAAMPGYRISWAFNLAGDWHDTSDYHIELNATAITASASRRGAAGAHRAEDKAEL